METDNIGEVLSMGQGPGIYEFLIRFFLNLAVIFVIVRLIYYPIRKNKEFVFTFFLFNIINFLLCFLLSAAKLKMGFAFGLFAIFSILRYRTVTVPVREMGYFFVSVTIGIINALASVENYMVLLLAANGIVLLLCYIIDYRVTIVHENYKEIVYERIDLIHPSKRAEMIEDLKARTGLNIHRVEFVKIDLFKDTVRVYAFYNADTNDAPTIAINSSGDDD